MARKIEISSKTIIFTVAFLGGVWFFYYIRDIVLQVFVALLIMTILNPTVTRLQKLRIPRAASVLVVYISVFSFLILSGTLIAKPLVEQTGTFANNLPQYLEELKIPEEITQRIVSEMAGQLSNIPTQIIRIVVSVFSNIMAVFTVLIFALYFLLARNKLDKHLVLFVHEKKTEERIERILNQLESKMGGWARGEIILMVCVGIATYVGLLIIGIPYAVPLALLAGILELVPNLGPTLGTIPSVIIGFTISPVTGLAAIGLGILIQQVENAVLVPKVMEKSVGVSPVITLLSLLIGFRVAGVVGAILSVPIVITLQVIISELATHDEN